MTRKVDLRILLLISLGEEKKTTDQLFLSKV